MQAATRLTRAFGYHTHAHTHLDPTREPPIYKRAFDLVYVLAWLWAKAIMVGPCIGSIGPNSGNMLELTVW